MSDVLPIVNHKDLIQTGCGKHLCDPRTGDTALDLSFVLHSFLLKNDSRQTYVPAPDGPMIAVR